MAEHIKSKEDREFTSSLGNWTGDYSWELGPHYERYGYMKLYNPAPNLPFYSQLQYPAIDPPANKDLTLGFLMDPCFHNNNLVSYSVKLSDGIYTLSPLSWDDEHTEEWAIHTLTFTTPALWNKLASKLRIDILNGPWTTTVLRFENFTLTTPLIPRTDHLPLMGVH